MAQSHYARPGPLPVPEGTGAYIDEPAPWAFFTQAAILRNKPAILASSQYLRLKTARGCDE